MTTFTLTIGTAGAAFADDPGELARILRDLASTLDYGGPATGTLRDANGNTVGGWAWGTDPDDEPDAPDAVRVQEDPTNNPDAWRWGCPACGGLLEWHERFYTTRSRLPGLDSDTVLGIEGDFAWDEGDSTPGLICTTIGCEREAEPVSVPAGVEIAWG